MHGRNRFTARRDKIVRALRTGSVVKEHRGFVKFYSAGKGYDFVVPDDRGRDVILHASVLNRAGLGALEPGQRVSFVVEHGSRGLRATEVELI